jgi:hypothetical protein
VRVAIRAGTVQPKPDDQRHKRFAVQPQLVHEPVHDKSRPGHVSACLEKGQTGEEQHDLRDKDKDPAHRTDHPLHHQLAQEAGRQQGPHLSPQGGKR